MSRTEVTGYQFDHAPVSALADSIVYKELSGRDRVIVDYKNGLKLSSSGSTISIDTGAVLVRGRLVEVTKKFLLEPDNTDTLLVVRINLERANSYNGTPDSYTYDFKLEQADIITVSDLVDTDTVYDIKLGSLSWVNGEVTVSPNSDIYSGPIIRDKYYDAGIPELQHLSLGGNLSGMTGSKTYIGTYSGMHGASNQFQNIMVDPYTNHVYVTQVDNSDGFSVHKNTMGGSFISTMWLSGMGHGQAVYLNTSQAENFSGTVFIQFVLNNNIYEIRYEDFTTKTINDANLIMSGDGINSFYSFDVLNGIMVRQVRGLTNAVFDIQSYSKDGSNYVLSGPVTTFDTGVDMHLGANIDTRMQAFKLMTDTDVFGTNGNPNILWLFVHYGAGGSLGRILTIKIDRSSMSAEVVGNVDNSQFVFSEIPHTETMELEGMERVTYTDGITEHSMLIFGVFNGVIAQQNTQFYSWGSEYAKMNFRSYVNMDIQERSRVRLPKVEDGSYIWMLPPGMYRINKEDMAKFVDPPRSTTNVPSGYWYVEVSPVDTAGDKIITATIPDGDRGLFRATKMVNFNGSKLGKDYAPYNQTPWLNPYSGNVAYGSISNVNPVFGNPNGISVRVGPTRVQIFISIMLPSNVNIGGETKFFDIGKDVPVQPNGVGPIGFLYNISSTTVSDNTAALYIKKQNNVSSVYINGTSSWDGGNYIRGEISYDY